MYKLGKSFLNLWDEPFMQDENMKDTAKLLYLYLLTNALSNIAGIYKITEKRIKFDLGEQYDWKSSFDLLKGQKKVYRCGDWVIIKDAPLYIKQTNKTIKKEMDEIYKIIPDKIKEKLKRIHYKYDFSTTCKEKEVKIKSNKEESKNKQLLFISGGNYDKENPDIMVENENKNMWDKDSQTDKENKNYSLSIRECNTGIVKHNEEKEQKEDEEKESLKTNESIFLPSSFCDEQCEKKAEVEEKESVNIIKEKSNVVGLPFDGSIIFRKSEEEKNQNKNNYDIKKESDVINTDMLPFEPNEPIEEDYILEEEQIKPISEEDKQKEIQTLKEWLAKEILKEFQKEGFYQGIAFNYFLLYDFNKALKSLENKGIIIEDKKEAYKVFEVARNFIKVGKLQQKKATWFDISFLFYKLCDSTMYRLFEPELFDINQFNTTVKPQKQQEEEEVYY